MLPHNKHTATNKRRTPTRSPSPRAGAATTSSTPTTTPPRRCVTVIHYIVQAFGRDPSCSLGFWSSVPSLSNSSFSSLTPHPQTPNTGPTQGHARVLPQSGLGFEEQRRAAPPVLTQRQAGGWVGGRVGGLCVRGREMVGTHPPTSYISIHPSIDVDRLNFYFPYIYPSIDIELFSFYLLFENT